MIVNNRLIGIGSEWSVQFPGYLAGAVDAAERGVRQIGMENGRHTKDAAA